MVLLVLVLLDLEESGAYSLRFKYILGLYFLDLEPVLGPRSLLIWRDHRSLFLGIMCENRNENNRWSLYS